LILKFASGDLQNKLLKTKYRYLVEGNTWGDVFWGQYPIGTGENNLGKQLEYVREFYRQRLTALQNLDVKLRLHSSIDRMLT